MAHDVRERDVGFRHEAALYAGEQGFVEATLPFIRQAVASAEPILVVVSERKIGLLRSALGREAGAVSFADMQRVGANPGRIIPAWQDFVDGHRGHALRGIGEPIDSARADAELAECHRHEALLNVAFADASRFTLLCPYDTEALQPHVVAEARRTHPHVRDARGSVPSALYTGLDAASAPFDLPMPEPPDDVLEVSFDGTRLAHVREIVMERAVAEGLEGARAHDLRFAVGELTTNSTRHGGGSGVLRLWREEGRLVVQISDQGRIADPLAGRRRPTPAQRGGYGLWLANQLCDLVQIRAVPGGVIVRVHMRLA
jgi:anti-sigma regulatory factor (Ser/Thr protein kinase)